MECPVSKRFEVGVSRWKAILVTVLLSTWVALMLFCLLQCRAELTAKPGEILSAPILVMFAILSVASALSVASCGLWLRRRPLFVIDDQGITDHGYYSQGFGLIRWQNIEDTILIARGRDGLSLLIKVNNYNELVSQRNLLMQPLLLLSCGLNGFFGAQIALRIAWGDTDVAIIRQQISNYSKNKIQVPEPLGFFQTLLPMLAQGTIIALLMFAIFVAICCLGR